MKINLISEFYHYFFKNLLQNLMFLYNIFIMQKRCEKKKEKRNILSNINSKHICEGVYTMEITDIRIKKRDGEGRMKAIVSITFDNEFVIHDVKIIKGNNGSDFIAMPSRKTPDGEYKDIAHPISAVARERLEQAILAKYKESLGSVPVLQPVLAE